MKFASGLLPIATSTKELCLAWRSPEIEAGNRYGVIGGMLKDGLDLKQNALVELAEEVGYRGPVELHSAFAFTTPTFHYQNFIGIVPEPFEFHPMPEYMYETSFISWLPLNTIMSAAEQNPKLFHAGLLALLRNSYDLIVKLLE
jgi:hypothetical protein